ncbi:MULTISPECIES: hypothetical protein [unclassified Halomonas]|uniref:hypothetical protein n=1 Tax=unclassified Halomonas TaxID=2609666 RepID=UPI000BB81546|nr:hypothetical protein [Halomonas sp. JB37]PCC22182.1 hypothetical protein CIK78_09020 [Halomonas sp. JB37]
MTQRENAGGSESVKADDVYTKTLYDFSELEIIKLLGWMHGECLSGRASDKEIRDFVLGIYRTRFMAAGYGKQLFLSQGGGLDEALELSDELSKHSPIAQMSFDARVQFSDVISNPFDIIKPEAEEMLKSGGLMANLVATGKPEIAQIIWRDAAKGVFHSL